MAMQERPEVHRRLAGDQIEEEMRPLIISDADRQLVGEVANRLLRGRTERQRWQLVDPQCGAALEVLNLLALGAEPPELWLRDDSVEKHQPLHRPGERHRLSVPIVRLA